LWLDAGAHRSHGRHLDASLSCCSTGAGCFARTDRTRAARAEEVVAPSDYAVIPSAAKVRHTAACRRGSIALTCRRMLPAWISDDDGHGTDGFPASSQGDETCVVFGSSCRDARLGRLLRSQHPSVGIVIARAPALGRRPSRCVSLPPPECRSLRGDPGSGRVEPQGPGRHSRAEQRHHRRSRCDQTHRFHGLAGHGW
jgi:hypothetical protein